MADERKTFEHYERSLTNVTPPPAVIEAIEDVRRVAKKLLERTFELVPESRERFMALTALEETVMWAVKALALHGRNDGVVD